MDVQLDDGDLSPVLRIEEVRFDNKRHYSHKSGGPVGRLIRRLVSIGRTAVSPLAGAVDG